MAVRGIRIVTGIIFIGLLSAQSTGLAAADGDLYNTPILHKPVYYGAASRLFLALVVVHIVPAVIAPISAVVALATTKGSRVHRRAGIYFVRSMAALALTGIVLDVVRLAFYTAENHTKYAGFSMPSTYPARIAFLFAGLCVLYLLTRGKPPGPRNDKPRLGIPHVLPQSSHLAAR